MILAAIVGGLAGVLGGGLALLVGLWYLWPRFGRGGNEDGSIREQEKP